MSDSNQNQHAPDAAPDPQSGTAPAQHQQDRQSAPLAAGGQDNRSESLLPGDDGAEDGRFDVAEEVSLDQQSDTARRIGQAPSEGIAESLPDALKTPPATQPVPDKS